MHCVISPNHIYLIAEQAYDLNNADALLDKIDLDADERVMRKLAKRRIQAVIPSKRGCSSHVNSIDSCTDHLT